jgi:hypothetical protein
MNRIPEYGALVISLDLELHWGVREILESDDRYRKNLEGESEAIRKILHLFREFEIAATWATVGIIFAESEKDLVDYKPAVLPQYKNSKLSPYTEVFEKTATGDTFTGGYDLIELIKTTPLQRIGTHTFSHYYCREEGQDAESFDADIKSAVAIAARRGIEIESIVFPRNQHNPEYDPILVENGIRSYRGNQNSRFYDFNSKTQSNRFYRAARLFDSYVNVTGFNTSKWTEMRRGALVNVKASMFLRPVESRESFSSNLQHQRISAALEHAAQRQEVFHLWWHPHNFGLDTDANIDFLRRVLEHFYSLRQKHGMKSLSMEETADTVLGAERGEYE